MWRDLLISVFCGIGLALLGTLIYCYILGVCVWCGVANLIVRCLAKKQAPKLKHEEEVRIEPSTEAIASRIIEENQKRWLEKQAEADAWLNEEDRRPYAKVLQFPRKL